MTPALPLHALVAAMAIAALPLPAPAAVVLGGTALLIDSPQAIDAGTLSFLPSGFGNTGTLIFTAPMSLPNAVSIASGAIANLQTAGFDVQLSGPIAGAGALSKQLPGTLTLAGTNTYSGGTTVSGGTLVVTNDQALGSGSLRLEGASLKAIGELSLANAFSVSGAARVSSQNALFTTGPLTRIAAGATLTIGAPDAPGTVVLRHDLSMRVDDPLTTTLDVTAGTLRLANLPADTVLPSLVVRDGAALDIAGLGPSVRLLGGTGTIKSSRQGGQLFFTGGSFDGTIDGTLALFVEHSTVLSGRNTPQDGTTIARGARLTLLDNATLSGRVVNDGELEFNTPGFMRFDAPVSGSGRIIKRGLGELTLSGENTSTGGFDLQRGKLVLAAPGTLGSGQVTLGDAWLHAATDVTLTNAFRLNGTATLSAARGKTLTWSTLDTLGEVSQTLRLGAPDADGTVRVMFLSGSLIPQKEVQIVAGTVVADDTSGPRFAIRRIDIAAGSTLDVDGKSATLFDLSGAGRIRNAGATAIVEVGGTSFNGTITGSIVLDLLGGMTLRNAEVDVIGVRMEEGKGAGIDRSTLRARDGKFRGVFGIGEGATATFENLTLFSTQPGGQGTYFQPGGTTRIEDRFDVGLQGRGLLILAGGSFEVNAAKVSFGSAANAAFDWRGGELKFLDDYTLKTGATLLTPSLELDGTQALTARNLTLANDANVALAGARLEAGERLHNAGVVSGQGILRAVTLANEGSLEIAAGESEVHGELVNLGGSIAIATDGTLSVFGDFVNNGSLHLDEGAGALFRGRVSGAGRFTGAGKSSYFGEFHVGNSPARVVLEGTQAFTASSSIDMDIAGADGPGDCASCYAQLVFDGPVTVDGATLSVNLVDGYTPRGGERYTLFVFNAPLLGGFGDLLLPKLTDGLQWDTSALMTLGELRVTAVPLPAALWSFVPALGILACRRRRVV